jgi:hypothetical protein
VFLTLEHWKVSLNTLSVPLHGGYIFYPGSQQQLSICSL